MYETGGELRTVVAEMETALRRLGAPSPRKKEEFLDYQRQQVETMVELERQFRDGVIAAGLGEEVYRGFLALTAEMTSAQSARAYFRERQGAFEGTLGPAVEKGDWEALTKYRVNNRFVQWAVKTFKLTPELQGLARQIEQRRHEAILVLMPLAINRTRIFRGRTPSPIELTDQAAGAFEGLLTAADKYCPPFTAVYRAVAIGRITANLIEQRSTTLLHFYPTERKILYRANKLNARAAGLDHEEMATRLNADERQNAAERSVEVERTVVPSFETNGAEVAELMAASSHLSTDVLVGRREVRRIAAPADEAPDLLVERHEAGERACQETRDLPILWRKLLVLKGMLPIEVMEAS